MKFNPLLILCFCFLLSACDKDKFESEPQISIKRVNQNQISINETLTVTLTYTDKEGDVDNALTIIRERLNKRNNTPPLDIPFQVPEFPDTNRGDIIINLAYQNALTLNLDPLRIAGTSNPVKYEVDTLRIKFVLTDKAGNKSDTATLNNIYVQR
jgi:hypothetical protein